MAEKPVVLVVDDEEGTRIALGSLLEDGGYLVDTAADGTEAVEKMKSSVYDLVITDLKMKGCDNDGINVLKAAKSQSYDPEVLLMTGYGSVESAVEAIKLGAFDYLTKPLDPERAMITVEQALGRKRLKGEITNLRSQVEEKYGRKNIIAVSSKMRRVLELADIVSRTDSTILIEGESGTGKELVARAMHFGGLRAKWPFVAVNCGALPEPLLESELFGHVKGAFTGAVRDKKGLFEEADRGTLLLDEVGDMPLPIQVKLLRALSDGEIRRVGSNFSINVDVRVIASTNKNLELLVEEGRFREDLFYRLRVVPITIPPLRERREDIMLLVNHFLAIYSQKLKKDVKGFSPETLEILLNHNWPGNVRELENLVEGAITLNSSPLIKPSDIAPLLRVKKLSSENTAAGFADLNLNNLNSMYEIMEKEYILRALEKNSYDHSQTAKALGIDRSSLWRKMKKHSIKRPS